MFACFATRDAAVESPVRRGIIALLATALLCYCIVYVLERAEPPKGGLATTLHPLGKHGVEVYSFSSRLWCSLFGPFSGEGSDRPDVT